MGVKTPKPIPPKIINGIPIAKNPFLNPLRIPLKVGFGPLSKFLFTEIYLVAMINEIQTRIPGIAPAKNRLPIDTPAMLPYITNAILGGTIGPIVAEAAVTTAENALL